jgi:hypothetical protein
MVKNAELTKGSPVRKRLFIAVVVIVTGAAASWFFWPGSMYSRSRVHPSVRNLQEPYRMVWTDFLLDGGSVGIKIVDRDNRAVELALPVFFDSPRPPRYDRLFVGSFHFNKTNSVEVPYPEPTKRMLADIIDRYVQSGIQHDAAVIALRGAPKDYVRAYLRVTFQQWGAP